MAGAGACPLSMVINAKFQRTKLQKNYQLFNSYTTNYQYPVSGTNTIFLQPLNNGTPAPININLTHLGALSYTWVVNSSSGNVSFYSSGSFGQIVVYNGGGIQVTCTVATACGTTSVRFVAVRSSGGGYYMTTSPNPASNELNIEVADSTATEAIDLPQNYQMRLYNPQNFEVMHRTSNKRNLKLNTSAIEEGIYYLEIIYREAVIRRRVVIRR